MLRVIPDNEWVTDEELLKTARQQFFESYRILRSDLFSDTETVYETRLTPELFDAQLAQLSTNKKQAEFENFVLALATRLITPNIKPQTGPDGGGDGKVDGETYPVDKAISDGWWVSDGSTGDQKWAIAVSVQRSWRPKVESDVKKAVETGRGYTKLLFFTNQKIKSSQRHAAEDDLSKKYQITVSIFDGSWCSFAVFEQNCMDVALEKLGFSDEYRRKTVIPGKNDKVRQVRLQQLEEAFSKRVASPAGSLVIDTAYVDALLEACLLSRGLNRSRMETEGRFLLALREARIYGTTIQTFNIVYNRALTSIYWFHDLDSLCSDYLVLKEFATLYPTVQNIEYVTGVLSIFIGLATAGWYLIEGLQEEIDHYKALRLKPDLSEASRLYLELFFSANQLWVDIEKDQDLTKDFRRLTSLIEKSSHYPNVSFEAQAQIVDLLGLVITDDPEFEKLVDVTAKISAEKGTDSQGAMTHLSRAISLYKNGCYEVAIKHLGPCIQSFYKWGSFDQLVAASDCLSKSLFRLQLPYSSKAFLGFSVFFLVQKLMSTGSIPSLLIQSLYRLCDLELLLGRLVMFLNWQEILLHFVGNGAMRTFEFEKDNDFGWSCHLATSDIRDPVFGTLPDILDRNNLPVSALYLRNALDPLSYSAQDEFHDMHELLLKRSILKDLLEPLSISTEGPVTLNTLANNCRFFVTYENSIKNQIVAETLLASIESFFVTFKEGELVMLDTEIRIRIVETKKESSISLGSSDTDYVFSINHETVDTTFGNCFMLFIHLLLAQNIGTSSDPIQLVTKHMKEDRIPDRVITMYQVVDAEYNMLGDDFKYTIERWKSPNDEYYPLSAASKDRMPPMRRVVRKPVRPVYKVSAWWSSEEWVGVRLSEDGEMAEPPIMEILVKNRRVGEMIARELQTIARDKRNINVVLIKGINREHPSWFGVCAAPTVPRNEISSESKSIVVAYRRVMDPETAGDPDRFEKAFSRFGKCRMVVRFIGAGKRSSKAVLLMDPIEFEDVIIKEAWRVSVNDPARLGVDPEDDPVIPDEFEKTAPVLGLLEELRAFQYTADGR